MNEPSITPYAGLDALLRDFVGRARAVLAGRFVGAYLHGSFALGDWDEHSDVDFVIAISEDLPSERVAALQQMHAEIYGLASRWARHLDGSYVPLDVLRRPQPRQSRLLYLDRGSRQLIRSEHCNRLVIRWMLRESGIALAGPPALELIDAVDPEAMCREVASEMREWAAEIDDEPSSLDNGVQQPYAVLSFCRMLYTLETGEIASKPVAAAWARSALAPQWSGLIARALAARGDVLSAAKRKADPADLEHTLAFIDAALRR